MVKFILMLMLAPLLCFANPAPFGLEIGKMTFQEFKEKYDQKYKCYLADNKGSSYTIRKEIFNADGLQYIDVHFDQNQVLVSMHACFHKDKYDYLLKIIEDKYKVTGKILFVEDEKITSFNTDELYINLTLSNFNLVMNYYSKKYLDKLAYDHYKESTNKIPIF